MRTEKILKCLYKIAADAQGIPSGYPDDAVPPLSAPDQEEYNKYWYGNKTWLGIPYNGAEVLSKNWGRELKELDTSIDEPVTKAHKALGSLVPRELLRIPRIVSTVGTVGGIPPFLKDVPKLGVQIADYYPATKPAAQMLRANNYKMLNDYVKSVTSQWTNKVHGKVRGINSRLAGAVFSSPLAAAEGADTTKLNEELVRNATAVGETNARNKALNRKYQVQPNANIQNGLKPNWRNYYNYFNQFLF